MKMYCLTVMALCVLYTSAQYFDERSFPGEAYFDDESSSMAADDVYSKTAKDLEHEQNLGVPYNKFIQMAGGAGKQRIEPANENNTKPQEVKTDKVLPSYCHPPNPCPKGYNAKDNNCQDQYFEDTSTFNQKLQMYKMERGLCTCDEEHMYSCPRNAELVSSKKKPNPTEDDIGNMVIQFVENGGGDMVAAEIPGDKHENLVAKKSPHLSRNKRVKRELPEIEESPDNIEDLFLLENNPYLKVKKGESLPIVAKKAPKM